MSKAKAIDKSRYPPHNFSTINIVEVYKQMNEQLNEYNMQVDCSQHNLHHSISRRGWAAEGRDKCEQYNFTFKLEHTELDCSCLGSRLGAFHFGSGSTGRESLTAHRGVHSPNHKLSHTSPPPSSIWIKLMIMLSVLRLHLALQSNAKRLQYPTMRLWIHTL